MARDRFILPAPQGPLPLEHAPPDTCPECAGTGRRGLTVHTDDYGHVTAIDAGPACKVCAGTGHAGATRGN